jgi:hypothetical protein
MSNELEPYEQIPTHCYFFIGTQQREKACLCEYLRELGGRVKPKSQAKNFLIKVLDGLPNRNRTCDPQLRRLMLYPTELWAARRDRLK